MRLFYIPLVSVHWVSDFHMSVPVSLHFNIVAVGQLLILVNHFQYPCFFSVCVSHLCTLPSPHLLKAGEVSLLQARLFVCISSSVSAPLPLLYLQTCLLFLWTWLFLPRNYVVAFQRMDCSEGAFLSWTAVHIHPNVSGLIRCQWLLQSRSPQSHSIYSILTDLMDYMRTSWQHVPVSAPFPNVSSHTWI